MQCELCVATHNIYKENRNEVCLKCQTFSCAACLKDVSKALQI